MGNISNVQLAAAVSNAGGLGTIGCGTMTPAQVEAIILETKAKTKNSFVVNIPISVSPYTKEMINLVLKHEIPVVSLSAGGLAPFIPLLQENNVKVIVIVASVKHAQKAEAAGIDVLVADNETIILGRSIGQVRRVLKAPYADRIIELEQSGLAPEQYSKMTSEDYHINGAIQGDTEHGFMNSGQVTGLIDDIPTVKELLEGMIKDARTQMEDRLNGFTVIVG